MNRAVHSFFRRMTGYGLGMRFPLPTRLYSQFGHAITVEFNRPVLFTVTLQHCPLGDFIIIPLLISSM